MLPENQRFSTGGYEENHVLQVVYSLLTTDPTRLEFIGANESVSMHGEVKLVAIKVSDSSLESNVDVDPSATNTHCLL